MKTVRQAAQIFFLCLLLVMAGCRQMPADAKVLPNVDSGFSFSESAVYSPAKIDILPLTGFVYSDSNDGSAKIRVYVSLLDAYDCQIKSPGVFRFELYEYVHRSAEPKGKRVAIWPDINLLDQGENHKKWRDFLRAYEFELEFGPKSSQGYILQVTCLCPNGRRLSAEFVLKTTK